MKQYRRSLTRPRYVDRDDKRPPMVRLLQDCTSPDGSVQPDYTLQFQTLYKASRLGYVDDRYFITEAGKAFLAKRAPVSRS